VGSMRLGRGTAVALAACALIAVFAAVAHADRVQLSAADQAAAKRDVLRRADLPTTVTWKATSYSSKNSGAAASCSRLDGNGSSVVDTAQAGSQFTAPGILVMNIVGLVATSRMLDTTWKQTFGNSPEACLRDSFAKGAGGRLKILSTTTLALPRLAHYENAYRMLFEMRVRGVTVYGACDMVAMGGERTMSLLIVGGLIGPAGERNSGEAAMTILDLRIAETLAGRAFKQGSSTLTA